MFRHRLEEELEFLRIILPCPPEMGIQVILSEKRGADILVELRSIEDIGALDELEFLDDLGRPDIEADPKSRAENLGEGVKANDIPPVLIQGIE